MKPGLSTQYQCVTLVLIQIIPTLIRVDPKLKTEELDGTFSVTMGLPKDFVPMGSGRLARV